MQSFNVTETAKDDLAFCASFLPPKSKMAHQHLNSSSNNSTILAASRRKSESALMVFSSGAAADHADAENAGSTTAMSSRVQEWIDEIQALDEEERRLELKEAQAADVLSELSLEEEMFLSSSSRNITALKKNCETLECPSGVVAGVDNNFDEDLDDLQELIERYLL